MDKLCFTKIFTKMENIYSICWQGAYGIMHFAAWVKGTCPNIGIVAENAEVGLDALRDNLREYLEFYDCFNDLDDGVECQCDIVREFFVGGGKFLSLADNEIFV